MSPDTKEKVMLLLVGSLLTLVVTTVGALVGQYLSLHNSEQMFRLQRKRELQERSYAKLVGLKVPWSQAIQSHVEANMLTQYYYVRFQVLSHDRDDLAEAKRQNDRALTLIPTISSLQRELFEALADVRIIYTLTPELTTALDDLYSFKTIKLQDVDRKTIKSEADLDQWKENAGKQVVNLAQMAYQEKIEAILPHLLKQVREPY